MKAELLLAMSNSTFQKGWELGMRQAVELFMEDCLDRGCDVCQDFKRSVEDQIEKTYPKKTANKKEAV